MHLTLQLQSGGSIDSEGSVLSGAFLVLCGWLFCQMAFLNSGPPSLLLLLLLFALFKRLLKVSEDPTFKASVCDPEVVICDHLAIMPYVNHTGSYTALTVDIWHMA